MNFIFMSGDRNAIPDQGNRRFWVMRPLSSRESRLFELWDKACGATAAEPSTSGRDFHIWTGVDFAFTDPIRSKRQRRELRQQAKYGTR